jgi:hypothetical protein
MPTQILFEYSYGTSTYSISEDSPYVCFSTSTSQTSFGKSNITDSSNNNVYNGGPNSSNLKVNDSLVLYANVGNPTTGDGTLDVHIWYRIVTL